MGKYVIKSGGRVEKEEVIDVMPYMDGITGYFDISSVDLANKKWLNRINANLIDKYDMDLINGGAKQNNALYLTAAQYGQLQMPTEPQTIYCVFKAITFKNTWCPIISKQYTTTSGGYGFWITLDASNYIGIQATGYDKISSIKGDDYHVVCITKNGSTGYLYIDGIAIGTCTVLSGYYGGNCHINRLKTGSGFAFTPTDVEFRMCAFGTMYHNEYMVKSNTSFLMNKSLNEIMPNISGITSYFDMSSVDLAKNKWYNQISIGNDILFPNGGNIQNNALFLSANQYGKLQITEHRTIYCVFKTLEEKNTWSPIISKGLSSGSTSYTGFWLSLDPSGNVIMFYTVNGVVTSTIKGMEYHVACITRDDNNVGYFYLDGTLIGTTTSKSGNYQGYYYLNRLYRDGGFADTPVDIEFKMCAFGTEYHNAAMVWENTNFLNPELNITNTMLYDSGVENTELTDGFYFKGNYLSSAITEKRDDCIYMKNSNGDMYNFLILETTLAIDLTDYTKLKAIVTCPTNNSSQYSRMSISKNPVSYDYTGYEKMSDPIGKVGTGAMITIDISTISGFYYVNLMADAGNEMIIYKIWLE